VDVAPSSGHSARSIRSCFFLRLSLFLLFPAGLSIGCGQSPAEQFARTLEQGVSFASAATYATELHARREVPDAYLRQLAGTAATNLQQIQTQVAKAKGVSQDDRLHAAAILTQEQRAFAGEVPDVRMLPDVQHDLSALIKQVRGQ
jgi:hypothetical protein